jgi:predicted  nucleic acid-binding Zn-ribbon protein
MSFPTLQIWGEIQQFRNAMVFCLRYNRGASVWCGRHLVFLFKPTKEGANLMTTTTTPSPAEQLASDIHSLQSDVNSLQSQVKLSSVRDAIEDLDTHITGLKQRVKDLRSQGYAYEKGLEDKATDLARRWQTTKPSVQMQINQQTVSLEASMRTVETQMAQLAAKSSNVVLGRTAYNQVKSAVENLESRASAAENTIRGSYDSIEDEQRVLDTHLDQVEWMLKQLGEASFQLLPTEAGIMAVEAVWLEDDREDKDDAKGVLYLTDQRLIFEQKQEVATKKVLFITTERKKVQEVDFEVQIPLIEGIKATKQGIFKNEDHLELNFASGAPTNKTRFHLFGQDCNEWQRLINQAKAKEFDRERAIEIKQEVIEKVKSAPTECPSCGGKITQVVARGMDSITCQYCGSVIRI